MPEYKYRGMLRNGKIVRGTTTAKSRHEVIVRLKANRIQPIKVKSLKNKLVSESRKKIDNKRLEKIKKDVEKQSENINERQRRQREKKGIMALLTSDVSFGGVKPKDVLTFTNSLYVLKRAKFNNVTAFESLFNSTQNAKLQDAVEDILIGIEAGSSIHEMMSQFPKIFPPLYVNFVRVGEESGSLDTALLHARDYMESSIKLRKQIRGILLPKILLFVFILIAMMVALLYGAPLIQNVYDMFGVNKTLPAITLWAISFSKAVVRYWYIVLALIIGIVVVFKIYLQSAIGRYQWDKFKIKAPVFGTLNLNIIANKFFKAMLLNLRNGMRIQESLETSKAVTDNYYFLSLVEAGKTNLQAGGSWIEPFEADGAFPPMAIEMLKIGMQSDLVEMMDKVEEYIEQEIDESIQKTIKVLPEITYVLVGIVLVFFVITVMVPLIDVYMGGFLLDGM